MRISVCLLIKDENQYLDEWLRHHRSIGISHFYIYDNHSVVPIAETLSGEKDCTVKIWDDQGNTTQTAAYNDCCKTNLSDDFILFIDTDEFLMIDKQFKSVQEVLKDVRFERGEFSALGIYWRIYGQPFPYLKTRQPVEKYTRYMMHTHIKTIVKPKCVNHFRNPHHAVVAGNYISEDGREITGPYSGFHTSSMIWIKHIFTRSEEEFKQKVIRGSGDKVNRAWSMTHFRQFNDECYLTD